MWFLSNELMSKQIEDKEKGDILNETSRGTKKQKLYGLSNFVEHDYDQIQRESAVHHQK